MAKRGRKKKRPSKLPYYKIFLINNGKQVEYFGNYITEKDANKAFLRFLEDNKKVIFPKRYLNTTKNHNGQKPKDIFISESDYELIIVKRKGEFDTNMTRLRNEYGEFVEHQTTSDTWILYDKAPYEVEEEFWVWGYNPFQQRKNADFILENIVKPRVTNKYSILEMRVYQNKLLLETIEDTNMIICKNGSDCIRLYNTIERWCDEHKYRFLLPCGQWNGKNSNQIIDKIIQLTGWSRRKVMRSTTNTK